jgi:hypothetical protein
MPLRHGLIFVATLVFSSGSVLAGEKYLFHENVHVGQRVAGDLVCEGHVKRTTTSNGESSTDDYEYKQMIKTAFTVLAVNDGSATEIKVYVDPTSYDTTKNAGEAEQRTPCSYAGKTLMLRRKADDSVASDFTDHADATDEDNVESLLNPDEDFYPDQPVAVGDTWDASAKLTRHADLGPQDQLTAICRLDWVKQIDGKKMAQISCSEGTILVEEGNVEEDVQCNTTLLVDMAANQILNCVQKGTGKWISPGGDSDKTTGGSDFSYVGRVFPDSSSTKP